MSSHDIPWDIIVEILSQLPIKSLIRFKCVSKSFHYLISRDVHFKKKHLRPSNSPRAIIRYEGGENSVITCHPLSLGSDNMIKLEPSVSSIGCLNVRGMSDSCDGMFCVRDDKSGLVVWNPHTRESKKISDFDKVSWSNFNIIEYGLAYDSFSNDYKVIVVLCGNSKGSEEDPVYVYKLRIYSLKLDSGWRDIRDEFPCKQLLTTGSITVVDGALHWIAYDYKGSPYVLTSFDIANEKFNIYALPSALGNNDGCDWNVFLCVLREKLCIYKMIADRSLQLWMMEECGVAQSLKKIVSTVAIGPSFIMSKPVYMFEDGTLIIHDFLNGRIHIAICKDGVLVDGKCFAYNVLVVYVCKESIVSPHMYEHK